jgi:hypothetical protein
MRRRTLDQIEALIKRRQARIRRDANAITKLEAQRKRLLKARVVKVAAPVAEKPRISEDLSIPTFLQRKRDGEERDKIAAAAILAEQAERKRTKTRIRIEEMKAKQSGATRRMPLTGKEAMAAIAAAVTRDMK